MKNPNPRLLILTELKAQVRDNRISITRKFIDGIIQYQKFWTDPISVFLEESKEESQNLDNLYIDKSELPFELKIVDYNQLIQAEEFQAEDIVLSGLGFRTNHISQFTNQAKVPCVYITENSKETRLQCIRADIQNPLLRLRRNWWETQEEKRRLKAIHLCQGLQCNGTPTYEDYGDLTDNSLLFFDTRTSLTLLMDDIKLSQKLMELQQSSLLRLAFSGRLVQIKGVSHLIDLAQVLKDKNIPFKFYICGDGDLFNSMKKKIEILKLEDHVEMLGNLEFKAQLVPFLQDNVDLFVCCHRQGDPSCTYLETMSCGIPIIGYDNAAFSGIVEQSHSGWKVPMDDLQALANKIVWLNNHRQEIADHARRALTFAKHHTFEQTFNNRINHLKQTYERYKTLRV